MAKVEPVKMAEASPPTLTDEFGSTSIGRPGSVSMDDLASTLPGFDITHFLAQRRALLMRRYPAEPAPTLLQRLKRKFVAIMMPIRFSSDSLEEQYQRWQLAASRRLQRLYHLYLLFMILLMLLPPLITKPQLSFLFILLTSLTLWAIAGGLVWRKERYAAHNHILATLHTMIIVLNQFAAFYCRGGLVAPLCDAVEIGRLNGVHYFTFFSSVMMYVHGYQMQGIFFFAHIATVLAVWLGLLLATVSATAMQAVFILSALFLLVFICVAVSHEFFVVARLQFQLFMDFVSLLREKEHAIAHMDMAHEEVMRQREKVVRAVTAREIHESLMGYVCHNMRNPLHSIQGLVRHLKQQCSLSHTIERLDVENLDLIEDSVTQITRVADDVLEIQKLYNGTAQFRASSVMVRSVIRDAVAPIQQAYQVQVDVDLEKGSPKFAVIDGPRITKMLSIGLQNAVKHQTPNSSLQVKCFMAKQQLSPVPDTPGATDTGTIPMLQFEVWNEGQGLGTSNVMAWFQPYDGDASYAIKGLGIGLQMSHLIAQLMGGQVGLEDRGRYTVYWFTVPLGMWEIGNTAEGSPSRMSLAMTPGSGVAIRAFADLLSETPWTYWGRPPEHPTPPFNVLVVDDLRPNRRLILSMLKHMNHNVSELEDGDQIMDALHDGQLVDVILLDIHMSRSDGRDITRLLREQGYGFPIIAVTGNVGPADVASYRAAGFDGVLGKPFTSQHVVALFQAMCVSSLSSEAV